MPRHESVDGLSVAERWNRVFRVLSHDPRRQLVLTLSERPPETWVTLPEAARSSHFEGTRDELTSTLVHQHLPSMADAGYVRWRSSPFEVTRGPHFQELGDVLQTIVSEADALPRQLVHGCEPLERQLG